MMNRMTCVEKSSELGVEQTLYTVMRVQIGINFLEESLPVCIQSFEKLIFSNTVKPPPSIYPKVTVTKISFQGRSF